MIRRTLCAWTVTALLATAPGAALAEEPAIDTATVVGVRGSQAQTSSPSSYQAPTARTVDPGMPTAEMPAARSDTSVAAARQENPAMTARGRQAEQGTKWWWWVLGGLALAGIIAAAN